MSSWLDSPQERQQLAATLHTRHQTAKSKQQATDTTTERIDIDNIWEDACRKGIANGKIRLCWLDLKQVSNRVYSFRSTFGRELQELVLEGIGLSVLEDDLFTHCADLTHLSVASNHIKDLTGIHSLNKLLHLNLLRNNLQSLPSSIGRLLRLTQLNIANNKLTELPDELSNLKHLTSLNLESNELSELPINFGKLACSVVNINCNSFRVFPDCILDMPNLRQFSIMANEIDSLAVGMDRFKCLEVFHASRNKIMILPDSIVKIPSLRCLWLDHNKLSALPPNFHMLRKLSVLKLEGNVDMIYPTIDTIAMGATEVLRWSRGRLETKKASKVRDTIQSLEEVLGLVERHKIGGDLHESLFRVNEDCYQFPPDALWSVFIPELRKMWSNQNTSNDGIKSFAFERNEVEMALFAFCDAAGPIVKRVPAAKFRRCSCLPRCIPPKVGYMCQRPAVAVRMKVAYEENMIEKRRLREEEKRIDDAARAVRTIAQSFLESDDGIIMVRAEAEKRIALREEQLTDDAKDSSTVSVNVRIVSGIHSMRSRFGQNRKPDLLKQIEDEIRAEYINREVSQKKREVVASNKKIVDVMKRWLGVTTDEVFLGWRKCIEISKKQARKEQRKQRREDRLQYEDQMAAYELKKLEIESWVQQWDGWNDVENWVHLESGETTLEKPRPPLLPLVPRSLVDAVTGTPLSPRTVRRDEVESSSDESWSSTDEDFVHTERSYAEHDSDANTDGALLGRDTEFEVAAQRVLERRVRGPQRVGVSL